ncbi:MAG TPA: histidine kinase [Thermoanaerobaculia bacterium]|nr:histidine kinase [Thermoanaerobaculia bacterium]
MLVLVLFFATVVSAENVEIRISDDPSARWTRTTLSQIPEVNDTIWIRSRVELPEARRATRMNAQPLALYFGALASHELWWDGVLLGRGGVPARSRDAETPGPIEVLYPIPDALATPGVHTVTIRTSAFHRGFHPKHGYWSIVVARYDRLLAAEKRSANRATIALSGILLTAVFAFAMYWLARRDRSFLLLGTLCLAAAALLIAEAWRPLVGYTYDWHIVRLRCIIAGSWLVGVQLVALAVTRFPHRFGRPVLLATSLAATAAPFFSHAYDPKSLYIFSICCSVALAWTIFAAVRRMHGSALALIGVGATTLALLFNPWGWVDNVVYFALLFLFVCLLCSHALEVRREQDERARLELEMVRRQLQPHFLMNTLTALSEWIEQEPRNAVRMIEALSEELRTLREFSNRALVPLGNELRLCRSHIANMSLRNDATYRLEVDADSSRLVPPAVFHTLVENATTHASAGVMTLSQRQRDGRVLYVFEAPASSEGETSSPGVGTRYIEARLREVWGDAWTFRQGRFGATWRAEIEVPA